MKKWKILHEDSKPGEKKSIEQIIQALLHNRGIITRTDIDTFLHPKLEKVTCEAIGISMVDIKKTITRIDQAVQKNETIVVYGDYDVDGICGTAILWETLSLFCENVHPYIPHRIEEGYGLSQKGIENIQETIPDVGLIITIDNGIVATVAVDFANQKGIDVIITDHHVKGKKLPNAVSIVHSTDVCGTGVAYLLAQEMIKEKGEKLQKTSKDHLALVAMATVADLVPLNSYNRALLRFGIEELRKTTRPGIVALCREAKIQQSEIDTYQIGHILAPRLNASGRISSAMDSLRLICTKDPNRAQDLALILGEINRKRQQLTLDSANGAKEKISNENITNIIFSESRGYEQGVIGLIASKLVEEFYRPTIVISIGDKVSKGSARSISGVNIIELIRSCSEFLLEVGGHPMAAGFSIETKNLDLFKKELQKRATAIDPDLFIRNFQIDLELEFDHIVKDFYHALQNLSPFGMGNPPPIFTTKGVTIVNMLPVGREKNHLQIMVEKDGAFFKGMIFRFQEKNKYRVGDIVDIAYSIELNTWNGNEKIELKIKDIATLQ